MSGDVRENRMRRMAKRQGLILNKNRRRDPKALDYGRYWLVRDGDLWPDMPVEIHTDSLGLTLDEVEAYLTAGDSATAPRYKIAPTPYQPIPRRSYAPAPKSERS